MPKNEYADLPPLLMPNGAPKRRHVTKDAHIAQVYGLDPYAYDLLDDTGYLITHPEAAKELGYDIGAQYVLLVGPPGVGKTKAVDVLRDIIGESAIVRAVNTGELFNTNAHSYVDNVNLLFAQIRSLIRNASEGRREGSWWRRLGRDSTPKDVVIIQNEIGGMTQARVGRNGEPLPFELFAGQEAMLNGFDSLDALYELDPDDKKKPRPKSSVWWIATANYDSQTAMDPAIDSRFINKIYLFPPDDIVRKQLLIAHIFEEVKRFDHPKNVFDGDMLDALKAFQKASDELKKLKGSSNKEKLIAARDKLGEVYTETIGQYFDNAALNSENMVGRDLKGIARIIVRHWIVEHAKGLKPSKIDSWVIDNGVDRQQENIQNGRRMLRDGQEGSSRRDMLLPG